MHETNDTRDIYKPQNQAEVDKMIVEILNRKV